MILCFRYAREIHELFFNYPYFSIFIFDENIGVVYD